MLTIILIGSGALILILAIIILSNRPGRAAKRDTSYIEALHKLLDGNMAEALELLKQTVRRDSENIMAYIKLGDIYRQINEPVRAAKIHRNLLVRSDLTEKQTRTVLFHLVEDYRCAGANDKAVEMAERLVEKNRKNIEYQKLLLSVYEEKNDWDKAFFYRQSLNKWQKKADMSTLALYKIQAGTVLIESNLEREGRIRFREARKLNKSCIPAYLYWGDSYRRENKDEEALNVWREFIEKVPEHAHLAFTRLQDVLFDLGQYSELEKIYLKIINRKPDNPEAGIGLAELYYKQGKLDAAITLCEEILHTFPNSVKTMHFLVELYYETGDKTGALEMALKAISQAVQKSAFHTCSGCGNVSEDVIWHCPQCGGWDTYLNM